MLRYLTAIPLLAATAAPALAQSEPEDEVVVTANNAPAERDETGRAITVLDEATIRTRQTATVADLLATTPGVAVAHSGPVGGVTSLFVRGAVSDETLVLIDGVRINDAASPGGAADLGPLLTGNVSRIEVLRGPNSVIWGSQAIGGVVNIETEAPSATPSFTARAEGGYAGTANLVANAATSAGPIHASVGGYYYRTDGISAYAPGPERDGLDSTALNARVTADLAQGLSLDTRVYYVDARLDLDGGFPFADSPERSKERLLTLYSGLNSRLLDNRLHQRLGFAYTNVDRRNLDPRLDPVTTFDSNGSSRRYEYQASFAATKQITLIAGAEHEDSAYRTAYPSPFDPDPVPSRATTGITSLYAQAVVRPVTGLTLTGGARHDWHRRFGEATTLGGSVAYTPNGGATLLRANYAQGFKAPTLFQLLSDYGNPDLKPERADAFDAGVEQRFLDGRAHLAATYFHRVSRDQIDYISCFPATLPICATRPYGTYDNIARARAEGIEIEAGLTPVERLSLTAQYTHLTARDRVTGRRLALRPADTASASADYRIGGGPSLGLTATHVGPRFNDTTNLVRLKGYTLVDVRAAYPVTRQVELYARLENALDERYQSIATYGTYPRAAYAGVRARL